ncbi:MAG: alpha/beta hydrolase [Moraxellaceae bacterium]|nr:alpha/beta hydrolase [Moraxellaceae bacterium]
MQLSSRFVLSCVLLASSLLALPAQASVGAWIQEKALGLEQSLADLERRDIQIDDHVIPTFVRNIDSDEPCAILVHGFTARAAHWFRLARHLPKEKCVVAMDLAGFGDATFHADGAYDAASQAHRVAKLMQALELKQPADVMGNSMGGYIVAQLAVLHPELVNSLTLLNASGVSSPEPSTLAKQIAAGQNGFFAKDLEGFEQFYAMTMSEPPFVPGIVREAVGRLAISRISRHQYIFEQVRTTVMDDDLRKIKAPTLIVWGDEDHLLHVSMTKTWRTIPESRVFIYRGIGHMPHLERPKQTATLFHRFTTKQL